MNYAMSTTWNWQKISRAINILDKFLADSPETLTLVRTLLMLKEFRTLTPNALISEISK